MELGPIDSLEAFITTILGRAASSNSLATYRGHGNRDFPLKPAIFRSASTRENEHILVRELVAAHPADFTADTSALELLVRMQHYSLPTRLLDISFNPLVALYFACEPTKRRIPILKGGKRTTKSVEADGQVVILTVPKSRVRYFDSDTVSCLTNLARLRNDLKDDIDTGLDQTAFNQTLPIKRLVHFIRQEKTGFEPEIVPSDIEDILLVKPKQNNRRILAQAGAFFVFGQTIEITEPNDHRISVDRVSVAADHKPKIRADLDKLGINEKTLFPEIDRAARYITGSLSASAAVSKLI